MISQETNNKVAARDIVRMVNAVFKEATRHSLDPFLLVSLVGIESRYQARAASKAGARGLMQVIPRWHRDKIKGRDIMNIETNIEVGSQILADCLDNNNGNLKKASRCYSGNAKNYVVKLKDGHNAAKKADVLYRFENELPLAVDTSESPVSISVSTEQLPLLARKTLLAESSIY